MKTPETLFVIEAAIDGEWKLLPELGLFDDFEKVSAAENAVTEYPCRIVRYDRNHKVK